MIILECYGWKIPANVNGWDVRKGTFEIDTDEDGNKLKGDRTMRLEIDLQYRKSRHRAIRLSVIPTAEKFVSLEPRFKIDEPVDSDMEDRQFRMEPPPK